MTEASDPYGLLITHAETWARTKKRQLDADLLGTILSLRDVQDRVPGTSWPAGSAEYLMTVRWPGHGPAGVPDMAAFVATLDTYWRFLRATGRMSSESAEPAALLKEAKRATPRMVTLCEDPSAFSFSKSLIGFGSEIGIELDGEGSIEDLQGRLDTIVEAWNNLPQEERRTRSPGLPGAGSVRSAELDAMVRGTAPGAHPEADTWPERDPEHIRQLGAAVRETAYVQSVLRLVEWVGPQGRPATASGYLKPAVARDVIAELGLDAWYETLGGEAPPAWRSAKDHQGLHRLYDPALTAGLLEIVGGKVVARPLPQSDPEWSVVGVTLLLVLVDLFDPASAYASLLALLGELDSGRVRTVGEAADWWVELEMRFMRALAPAQPEQERHYEESLRAHSAQAIESILAPWRDTGVIEEHGPSLRLGLVGRELVTVAAALLADDDGDDAPDAVVADALAALEDGDPSWARDLVEEACERFPSADPHEPDAVTAPVPAAALDQLFTEVAAAAHDAPDSVGWVDTCAAVLKRQRGTDGQWLQWMLHALAESPDVGLPARATRRIRTTIPTPRQMPAKPAIDAPVREQVPFVWRVLELTLEVHRALFHGDEP